MEKDFPGFIVGKKEKKMGLGGSSTTELIFDQCRVPVQNRLGEEGNGLTIALANLDVGRIGIAAQALGIAESALKYAQDYAKERKQFGRPIGAQQAIAFKLADMATKVEAARLLTYRAAFLRDQGLSCSKEASMAKMMSSDAAVQITTDAIQIFGVMGIRESIRLSVCSAMRKSHRFMKGRIRSSASSSVENYWRNRASRGRRRHERDLKLK